MAHLLGELLVVRQTIDLLDLVELVDAVEAVGVLAGGAGLAAEAGAEGDVFLGELGFCQDFVACGRR